MLTATDTKRFRRDHFQFPEGFRKEKRVRDHEKAIRLFENEAKHGQNRDLQEFASKTVPTLREHLKLARELDSGRK